MKPLLKARCLNLSQEASAALFQSINYLPMEISAQQLSIRHQLTTQVSSHFIFLFVEHILSESYLGCEAVGAGTLAKGLKIASVSIVESCRDVVTKFQATSKSINDQITSMNSPGLVSARNLLSLSLTDS